MKKILITGGPVPGKLDDVKIITNRFKGGLIARLADELQQKGDLDITYLTYKGSQLPTTKEGANFRIVFHDGFFDYEKKVLELAPKMDGVILGAAVANLIPLTPFEGKFPSHNYKPGDIIPIEFTIAPRVIDQVRKANPNAALFGFKLLSKVPHEELIRAAYEVCISSKATAIFANDTSNLSNKFAITKEHSVIPLDLDGYTNFIYNHLYDEYYHTEQCPPTFENSLSLPEYEASVRAHYKLWTLSEEYKDRFVRYEEYLFGTIAVRAYGNQFVTTIRGKNELEDSVLVRAFYQEAKVLSIYSDKKATLNAPLLAALFANNPDLDYVVHLHTPYSSLSKYEYQLPGTVAETEYGRSARSFNIKHHGCILMFNKKGELML